MVYTGKVQVTGQRWQEEVVLMTLGLVSLTINKIKSNNYGCKKLLKCAKSCRQKGTLDETHPPPFASKQSTACALPPPHRGIVDLV